LEDGRSRPSFSAAKILTGGGQLTVSRFVLHLKSVCHPEESEEAVYFAAFGIAQVLRFAQNDKCN
jgi:hypothetical protein